MKICRTNETQRRGWKRKDTLESEGAIRQNLVERLNHGKDQRRSSGIELGTLVFMVPLLWWVVSCRTFEMRVH